ncbi:MAG: hypothetical protein FWC66_04510 [Oscillospiraceae bacterium]|nr:hypothetical protein [Oscillospiraceae bacterium]
MKRITTLIILKLFCIALVSACAVFGNELQPSNQITAQKPVESDIDYEERDELSDVDRFNEKNHAEESAPGTNETRRVEALSEYELNSALHEFGLDWLITVTRPPFSYQLRNESDTIVFMFTIMGSRAFSMRMSLNVLFVQATNAEIDAFMDEDMPRVSRLMMSIFPYEDDVATLISQGMKFFENYQFLEYPRYEGEFVVLWSGRENNISAEIMYSWDFVHERYLLNLIELVCEPNHYPLNTMLSGEHMPLPHAKQ